MSFFAEPGGYEKTILSDLQGAWECLRSTAVRQSFFEGLDRISFHIDEAMSWEIVRQLERMQPLLVLIRNIATQAQAPGELMDAIDEVADILAEVLQAPGSPAA